MIHAVLKEMLLAYRCRTDQDHVNALREIMQLIALQALSRHDFFNHAAFYGGTALRILYGLNRGSEDMDFSLLKPDAAFDLAAYAPGLEQEFASYGQSVTFSEKIKIRPTHIQSGFLKGNTQAQLISIGLDRELASRINARSEIKIKIEVDILPPPEFDTEIRYVYQPVPFAVRALRLPDLLAGKLHAVLFRSWRSRIKGRDWYDLAWYAGFHPEYRLRHLEARSRQSGDHPVDEPMTDSLVRELLTERLNHADMEAIKKDVRPFLRDPHETDHWSREFFTDVFRRLRPV